ncbi:MAG: tRNA adenosine(34) deaminase TadA [Planctomycetia bacterium]|nr:tRNA adenosine(34) deaminase TadA [Planctomycetia bacterium]
MKENFPENNADPLLQKEDPHSAFMRIALEEAQMAAEEEEVPIGAVLVHNGEILARDHNRMEQTGDPTAHAEILVIRKAAPFFPSWRIEKSILYATVEPCPMCAGAIHQARIDLLVYGTANPKAGAVHSLFSILSDSRLNHQCEIISGVLRDECADLLGQFFRNRRKQI